MMNIDNMKATRAMIASVPERQFNMNTYSRGTAKDIAGYAMIAAGYAAECVEVDPRDSAQDWLELTNRQANNLFCGFFSEKHLGKITRTDAMAELDRLIEEATE